MFSYLEADIITLQELKLQKSDITDKVGRIDGYQAFITVPGARCRRKGYAGVSVHVRVPKDDEPDGIKNALRVIKAEEGITGVLKRPGTGQRYIDSPADDVIGGYVRFNEQEGEEFEDSVLEEIDSEGRVVLIELANNTVVISTYCPANSMDTDEGELFRVRFISILFQRIRNLHDAGKQVVLMGDINISRDLIDSAPYISELLKTKAISSTTDESDFETTNKQFCQDFIVSTIPRKLLNSILTDSINPVTALTGIMYDTTRRHQGRRHKLYTVWNTMTNARPSNFGSRIDLILATKSIVSHNSGIWPQIMGSDHCPVYTDFESFGFDGNSNSSNGPNMTFEAAKFYKLGKQGALDMLFMGMRKRKLETESESTNIIVKEKPNNIGITSPTAKQPLSSLRATKEPTKIKPTQATLAQFFKKPTLALEISTKPEVRELLQDCSPIRQGPTPPTNSISLKLTRGKFTLPSDPKPPLCKHNLPSVLKTSRNENSKGKKFWSCGKPLKNGGDGLTIGGEKAISDDKEFEQFTCGFFKWK